MSTVGRRGFFGRLAGGFLAALGVGKAAQGRTINWYVERLAAEDAETGISLRPVTDWRTYEYKGDAYQVIREGWIPAGSGHRYVVSGEVVRISTPAVRS